MARTEAGWPYTVDSWRVTQRTPCFVPLPKLDVVGSSPIARSVKLSDEHLLNWPADLGRLFCQPATVTATATNRVGAGYRWRTGCRKVLLISLSENGFRVDLRALQLVRLP